MDGGSQPQASLTVRRSLGTLSTYHVEKAMTYLHQTPRAMGAISALLRETQANNPFSVDDEGEAHMEWAIGLSEAKHAMQIAVGYVMTDKSVKIVAIDRVKS